MVCLSCSRSCIASRDPYCGWMSHGVCERIQPGVLWVQASIWIAKIARWENKIMNVCSIWLIPLSPLCSLFRTGYEQDIELGNTARLGDCHGTNLISMPCRAPWDTCKHTHTDTHTLTRAVYTNAISTDTMSLHTRTSNHSVTCPYISLCAVLTHTSAYSTWPPVRQRHGHVQSWVMFSRCKWWRSDDIRWPENRPSLI